MVKRKAEVVINTPAKVQKTTTHSSPTSDSSGGSSDIAVTVASSQDLLVTIREAQTTATGKDVLLLSISNSRPDTALGKTQGDHVTAYKSLLEMLLTATEGQNIKKLSHSIADVAKALLPDKTEQFDEVLSGLHEEIDRVVPRSKRHEIIEQLKSTGQDDKTLEQVKKALKDSRRSIFIKAGEKMAQEFIKQINLDEETAFKKEGAADKTEGARVKKATHALKAINDLKSIYENSSISEKEMDRFYEKFIKTGAPYKDGANAIFSKDKITALSQKWTAGILDKKAFLNKLYIDTDKGQIGSFFGDLFDFKHSIHGNKQDCEQLLYKVTAKHLVIMFHAFSEFQSFDEATKDEVINKFLNEGVLRDQEWNQLKVRVGKKVGNLTLSTLKNGTETYTKVDEFRMLSDAEIKQNEGNSTTIGRSK